MILKKFILKLALLVIAFIGLYCFFIDKLSKGYVDEYYNKFTQEAGGLIIGLSRANEGISPYILEEELKDNLKNTKPIINFAINEAHFGKIYHESINKKMLKTNNGLFIISISPGNFTAPYGLDENQIYEFDKKLKMGKINNFTSSPNYDYIINNYGLPLYNTLHELDKWNHRTSHNNGWNEVILKSPNNTITDKDIAYWKSLNIKFYNDKAKHEKVAAYRHKWFIKTIKELIGKGNVFLVRMPSDMDILKLENNYWDEFDSEMDSISNFYGVPYFNYSNKSSEYKTYDGSHLESESAKKFTKQLCLDIKDFLKTKK
ncbi:hypothetical protein BFR04_08805 [Gaetbulibacter sp. 4G1]|nr:hypothetical protein [Gaetbulibacter sp. 4G1]PIA77529.1 hypothetical protein BFR04_08805 [Gaetbulibacter sp. 4G1]